MPTLYSPNGLIGICITRSEEIYKEAGVDQEGMNARQALQAIKGQVGETTFHKPKPCGEDEGPPDEPNVYCDGSLKNPMTIKLSLAAAGVWWPGRKLEEKPLAGRELQLAWEEEKEGQRAMGGPPQELNLRQLWLPWLRMEGCIF